MIVSRFTSISVLQIPHKHVCKPISCHMKPSIDWLLLFRASIPLGTVLLFCQEPAHVWGLSGQHLGSGETTQEENRFFCLAAFTYKHTLIPNTGLVSQQSEAGFLPQSWVSLRLPPSTLYGLAKAASILHVCYTNIWHKTLIDREIPGNPSGMGLAIKSPLHQWWRTVPSVL